MSSDYGEFIKLIKTKTNIDLSLYKELQLKRRMESLKDKRGFDTFKSYYEGMVKNRELFDEFLDKLTINVTGFYRNYQRWEVLEQSIIPHLLKSRQKLKVWSAACSTGEEPYTLAMILSKFMPSSQLSILATDLDSKVIEQAKRGVYSERSLQEVPEDIKKRFFVKKEEGYQVINEIKRTVTFQKHNLLSDVYPTDYDLIVCRNVLIYFTEDAKDQIYQNFNKSLRKDGILFVGSTEQIFNPANYGFDLEDTFFYRKI